MRSRLLTLVAAAALIASRLAAQAPPPQTHFLMPLPASINWQSGRLPISNATTVAVMGTADDRLKAATQRMMRRLESRTGFTMSRAFAKDPAAASILIDAKGPGAAIPSVDEDESYTLIVTGTQLAIRAPTVVGAMRGLEYEHQLIKQALAQANGAVTHAADLLGMTYQGLAYVIETRHRDLLNARTPIRRRPRKVAHQK